jgi:SAM-dependent methyltransferase
MSGMSEDSPKETTSGRFDASYYERVYNIDGVDKLDIHWWANRFYAKLARRLLRRSGGRRLLDIGCGQGFTLGQLPEDVEAWGLEVSDYAASRCATFAPRAHVLVGNIEDGVPSQLAPGSFDVVVMRYVLEHLKDPPASMARASALLRPGGYFLFAVPNTESPGRRWKKDQWFGCLDETHCSLLSPAEWTALVPASGLALEQVFSDGLWDVPYVKGIPRLLQYALFSLPTIFAVFFVSTALPLSWGENYIAIARKPEVGAAVARPPAS